MKRASWILLLVAVLSLCACGGHSYYPRLIEADSLCSVRPDSALALLQQLSSQMPTAPKADRMFFQLLCIKAADKCDRPITQCDSTILRLVDYYENDGDKAKLAETYYYAGRIFYEKQNAPQALDYYLKGLDDLEENAVTSPLKSVLCSQSGYIFMYQGLYSEGLKKFEAAFKNDSLNGDTLGILYDLRDMSTSYEEMGNNKKALYCLKKAYDIAKGQSSMYLALNVETYLSSLYRRMNNLDSALFFIRRPLDNVFLLDSSATYINAATTYYKNQQIDSALFYYSQIEKVGKVYAKETAYRAMAEIFLNRGNYAEAKRCFSQFKIYSDSVKALTLTSTIARINSLYNIQKKEKENQELRIGKLRRTIYLAFAIVMIMILLLYFRHLRKEEQERTIRFLHSEHLKEESLRKSYEQIEKNNQRIAELEKKLSNIDTENIILRNSLQREKERILSSNAIAQLGIKERKAAEQSVCNSQTYSHFISILDNHENVTQDDWKDLDALINSEYPEFKEKLINLCRLKGQEYRVSLLVKTGFEPTKIAMFLNKSLAAISTIRSRSYEKVFGKKGGAKDWDIFIKSL